MTGIGEHLDGPGRAPPRRAAVSLASLWFGLFGAPAAWALQLISNYALVAHACYPRDTPLASPVFGSVRIAAQAISAVLLIAGVAALLLAVRSWRRARREAVAPSSERNQRTPKDIGEGRTQFMALAGTVVSGIFVYGILMASVPLFSMRTCVP